MGYFRFDKSEFPDEFSGFPGKPGIANNETVRGDFPRDDIKNGIADGADDSGDSASAVRSGNVIGKEEIRTARQTLEDYKSKRSVTERRIINNQEWWRMRNWSEDDTGATPGEIKPSSGWLFSMLLSKHADAMDSFPAPNALPRAADDENAAKKLNSIIPCILDDCRFRQRYSKAWWDKLVSGVCIYGVYWNPNKNGTGDIDIVNVDPLSFYSDPTLENIQDSRNVFTVERVLKEEIEEEYPQLSGKDISSSFTMSDYQNDDTQNDDTDSVCVIGWYYKRKGILHYCKFVGEEILFASENEFDSEGNPKYPNGFYQHGKYPFVLDVMFPVKNSPYGSGEVDCSKNNQRYIDLLEKSILKTAITNSKSRYFVSHNSDVNETEFANTENEIVHCSGNPTDDHVKPIVSPSFNPAYLSVLDFKVNELKETTHNRDFSNGSSGSGITSGAAIAALQESGNKTSRDMIGESYFCFEEMCNFIVELIREFYTEERNFRITGIGTEPRFETFSSSEISGIKQNAFGEDAGDREAIFDIKVIAQKRSPYSREIQNQRAQELYGMGFFNPDNAQSALACLEMMDFEGKDKLVSLIESNNKQYMVMQQLAAENMQLKNALGVPAPQNANAVPAEGSAEAPAVKSGRAGGINTSVADKMRRRVQNGANPNI